MSSIIKNNWMKFSTSHPAATQGIKTALMMGIFCWYDLTRGNFSDHLKRLPPGLRNKLHGLTDFAVLDGVYGLCLGVLSYKLYTELGALLPQTSAVVSVPLKAVLHYSLTAYCMLSLSTSKHQTQRYRLLLLVHLINYALVPLKHRVTVFNIAYLVWNILFAELDRKKRGQALDAPWMIPHRARL